MEKIITVIKNKYRLLIFVILVMGIVFSGLLILHYQKNIKKSPLHQKVLEMGVGSNGWTMPENIPFAPDTGETLFLEGLQYFGTGDYLKAKELFETAIEKGGNDPALPGYNLFFLNEANYIITGAADVSMVEKTMEALTYYKPFKKERLWTAALTLAYQDDVRENGIKMLEDYLKINQDLEIENWAAIKNSIAMMEYMGRNYSKSIREFYDVLLRLENRTMTPGLKEELVYAREFIANMYFLFEDFEGAIELYNGLIADGKKNNEKLIYSHYINLSASYMKVGELDKAKVTIKELEYLLPDLNLMMEAEVKGNILEILASIAIEEDNYNKAGEYLEEAMRLYEASEGRSYYGGWYFVEMTYCKYLLHKGEVTEVISRLEQMQADGSYRLYGIEREVSELLLKAYELKGDTEKQIETYKAQLQTEIETESHIRREYLNFSKYYRDANRLQNTNVKLTRNNTFTFLIICISMIAYTIIYYFIRLLCEKDITDPLTGIYNRKKLNGIYKKFQKKGTPENIGIILADIDYFKKYNDDYGEEQGDRVLKEISEILVGSVRNCDDVIRYSGEEFLLILYDVEKETVLNIHERIKRKLKQADIEHSHSSVKPYVTMSMGICIRREKDTKSLNELVEIAEGLLGDTKRMGRDCCKVIEL